MKENQKINRKNLIISSISTLLFAILYGFIFKKLANNIPDITLFIWILGISILTGIGILALFPVYQKEKKKKKKHNYFKNAIMAKRK